MSEQPPDSAYVVNRDGWSPGPWDGEPDLVRWEAYGFPCLIRRAGMGHLCGYVAIPPGHPWHGMAYDDIKADAHGGLTFADTCEWPVCHVPKPGESDDVWWVGFDCGHAFDLSPKMSMYESLAPGLTLRSLDCGHYRTIEYVREVTSGLAAQARDAA